MLSLLYILAQWNTLSSLLCLEKLKSLHMYALLNYVMCRCGMTTLLSVTGNCYFNRIVVNFLWERKTNTVKWNSYCQKLSLTVIMSQAELKARPIVNSLSIVTEQYKSIKILQLPLLSRELGVNYFGIHFIFLFVSFKSICYLKNKPQGKTDEVQTKLLSD